MKEAITCHRCKCKEHVSDCSSKEATHYISGALYAISKLKLSLAVKNLPTNFFHLIDDRCSLNDVSDTSTESLNFKVNVDKTNTMVVDLGFVQSVHRPRITAEIKIEIPGYSAVTSNFQVMPILEK